MKPWLGPWGPGSCKGGGRAAEWPRKGAQVREGCSRGRVGRGREGRGREQGEGKGRVRRGGERREGKEGGRPSARCACSAAPAMRSRRRVLQ